MAAEWLRADQVQAIANRWCQPQLADAVTMRQALTDIDAFVAQDGRWRALVGAQSPYMQHQSACEYWHGDTGCDCGLCRLQAQAQAALAGEA